jgi:hypothetical protein
MRLSSEFIVRRRLHLRVPNSDSNSLSSLYTRVGGVEDENQYLATDMTIPRIRRQLDEKSRRSPATGSPEFPHFLSSSLFDLPFRILGICSARYPPSNNCFSHFSSSESLCPSGEPLAPFLPNDRWIFNEVQR